MTSGKGSLIGFVRSAGGESLTTARSSREVRVEPALDSVRDVNNTSIKARAFGVDVSALITCASASRPWTNTSVTVTLSSPTEFASRTASATHSGGRVALTSCIISPRKYHGGLNPSFERAPDEKGHLPGGDRNAEGKPE